MDRTSPAEPSHLSGRPAPWGAWGAALLGLLVVAGLGLRLWHLGAEGFADDEVHKWLAANRYLHGDFGGDDVEHPMLMKVLTALLIAIAPARLFLSPETLTRLPNALSGGVLVWAVAGLGRRLFGRATGLLAAALVALSATAVGYGRVAKEDVLLSLFTVLLLRSIAEAYAAAGDGRDREARRWELAGAASLAAMLASKYAVFVILLPPAAYAWLRAGGGAWRVPLRRWAVLVAVAAPVFLALDWITLMPSTLRYIGEYIVGHHLGDRAKAESLFFMGRLYNNLAFHHQNGVPVWFYLVFAAVKLAPTTVVLSVVGLGVAIARRAPAEKLMLTWVGLFLLSYAVMNSAYGRYFLPTLSAFALLAAHGAVEIAGRLRRPAIATGAIGLIAAGAEARATLLHMPHPRLYVNAFGGGDPAADWFFPHCDYFDAGVRETVAQIAARAEPDAQIAADPFWLARYYADLDGRPDLAVTPILQASACRRDAPCYVIVQIGRRYWHNEAALDRLAPLSPWASVDVAGHTPIHVYRLDAGAPLFPTAPASP
jgi:4-amino-4-deoxy-L-arabinose transferase-like glycosyltransferase